MCNTTTDRPSYPLIPKNGYDASQHQDREPPTCHAVSRDLMIFVSCASKCEAQTVDFVYVRVAWYVATKRRRGQRRAHTTNQPVTPDARTDAKSVHPSQVTIKDESSHSTSSPLCVRVALSSLACVPSPLTHTLFHFVLCMCLQTRVHIPPCHNKHTHTQIAVFIEAVHAQSIKVEPKAPHTPATSVSTSAIADMSRRRCVCVSLGPTRRLVVSRQTCRLATRMRTRQTRRT